MELNCCNRASCAQIIETLSKEQIALRTAASLALAALVEIRYSVQAPKSEPLVHKAYEALKKAGVK